MLVEFTGFGYGCGDGQGNGNGYGDGQGNGNTFIIAACVASMLPLDKCFKLVFVVMIR